MKQPAEIKNNEKGQSLVELGLVLVVVMVILAGVVDLGGIMFEVLTMRDAAQEGAAYASINPSACTEAVARVRESLRNPDTSQVEVNVTINGAACAEALPEDACASNEVVVTIRQANYPISMPFIGALIGKQTINLTSNMTSTILRPACQ